MKREFVRGVFPQICVYEHPWPVPKGGKSVMTADLMPSSVSDALGPDEESRWELDKELLDSGWLVGRDVEPNQEFKRIHH